MLSYDFEVDNVYYNVLSMTDMTVEVTRGENKYTGDVFIPSKVNYKGRNFDVVRVGESAFSYCYNLKSVKLSDSLKRIEDYGFNECKSLSNVELPNNLENIGAYVFYNCSAIDSIAIPSSVQYLGARTFYNCTSLKKLVFCDSNVLLSNYYYNIINGDYHVFEYCPIEYLYLGRSIEKEFWNKQRNLKEFVIGSSMTEWKDFYCGESATVIRSLIQDPNQLKPSFSAKIYVNSTLIVPKGSKNAYEQADGWNNFFTIEEDDERDSIDTACAEPTIEYADGKLKISSTTSGAECFYTLTATDAAIDQPVTNEINLTATYIITAYATAHGYKNSNVTTATLCWLDAQFEPDGLSPARIEKRPVIITSDNGYLQVKGLNAGETISVFSVDGRLISSTMAHSSIVTTDATMLKDGIAIIRIGDESIKVVVK